MKLNRADFIDTLKQAEPALSSQDFLPILSHYCFDGEKVTAYNDMQAVQVRLETDFIGGLPGSVLTKMLSSYSNEFVEINSTVPTEVEMKSGKSKIKLPLLPNTMFLFHMPELEDLPKFELNSTFLDGLSKTLISVGTDPTHPSQMGISLYYGKEVVLYSTDNLAVSKYTTKCTCKETGRVILPTPFCQTLSSAMKSYKADKMYMSIGAGFVVVQIGEKVSLFSKFVAEDEGHSLDFEAILKQFTPKGEKVYMEIPTEFESALERSLILLSKQIDKETSCSVKGKVVAMSTETPDGQGNDRVEFEGSFPEDLDFRVDPTLIKRVLTVCSEICFKGTAVLLKDERFFHLVSHYVKKS